MQYKQLAAVAAFAGLANAQSQCASLIQSFDPCVLGPIASVAYSSFQCDIVNFKCQCDNLTPIGNAAIPAAGMPPNTAATCGGIGTALDNAMDLCSCVSANSDQPAVTLNALQSACQPVALSIPACALGYIAEAGNKNHGCDIQDFACQCSNSASIQNEIFDSVTSLCGVNYAAVSVLPAVGNVCQCVSSQGASGPGTTSATTTDSGTVSSSTVPPTTGQTSSGVSTTSSGQSGSQSGTSSGSKSGSTGGSSTGTGSKTGGSSGSQSSGPSASGSNPATTPGPAKQSTTAGSNPGGSKSMPLFTNAGATASAFGGIFGIVAGAVAFL